jgi:putative transposase
MAWCGVRDITMHHIQPGKSDQNADIERFICSYREKVLDAYLFGSIEEAQAISGEWLEDYDTQRPHDGLGPVPPRSFLPRKPICRGWNDQSSRCSRTEITTTGPRSRL